MASASVVALLLALATSVQAQSSSSSSSSSASCSAAPSTLSSSCGGLCASNETCITYNATALCAGCVSSSDDPCQYLCLATAGENDAWIPDTNYFVLLVPFGSYQSEEEIAERAVNPDYDATLDATADNTSAFAWVNNNVLTAVDALEVPSDVTLFALAGGNTPDYVFKSKVVQLDLSSELITTQTQIETVRLLSIDLKDQVDDLLGMLPSSVSAVNLGNVLLNKFPTSLGNNTNIINLHLNSNYITRVNATDSIEQLQELTLRNNELLSFEASFPLLTYLDLTYNNLTAIPDVVFTFSNLQTLYMTGNLLESPTFTSAQADFLAGLTTFDLLQTDFEYQPNCSAAAKRVVHTLNVCISDYSADGSSQSDSGASSSSATETSSGSSSSTTTIVVVVVVVVVVAILGIVGVICWRKRKNAASKEDTATVSTLNTNQSMKGPIITSVWSDEELIRVQVRLEDIEDIRLLGSGAYGVVYLVRYQNSRLLASKRLKPDIMKDEKRDQALQFIAEIKLVAKLRHPKIVEFVGAAWTIESDIQALFEFMDNGDLRTFLTESNTPRHWTKVKLQLAIDVIEALVYVHSFQPPLIHRDLKSRNVLISADMEAKLTDFGVSRYQSIQETMTIGVGTGRWLAPEVINGSNDYGPAADIYSFGCVLSELDTHTIPYEGMTTATGEPLQEVAMLRMVASGVLRPTFTHMCPPTVLELAQLCMDQDPAKRPTAVEVEYVLRDVLKSMYPA